MNEIEYKLESTNPVLISHATSKLFESIKKKKCDRETDHISKIAEFKLLLSKRDSTNVTLSISACQALIALVENGLWDINEALSTFTSSISSIKNYMVATTTISHLLTLDLKRDSKNKIIYPFTLHTPQHPFISILIRDKRSWQTVLSQITFIVNHQDYRIKENSIKMLRPVFLYILCNPLLDSMDCCMQQVWQLLIRSKHDTNVQTEVLLWLCTTESHSCVNTNYRILELAEKALSEKNKEYCTALLPMIASLIIQLLKQDSDPRSNFDIILSIIDYCDDYIGNLMLILMAEVITLCPAIYLYNALQICMMITKKMSYVDIFFSSLKASVIKWMAYPSVLCSEALDLAKDLANKVFTKTNLTCNAETIFSNKLFTVFSHSDSYIQFYSELVMHCSNIWNSGDILSWLKNMSRVPIYLKDKCKLLISGLLLQSNESLIVELCCNILVDVTRETNSFGSHVLSLILHKLTKCKSSTETKCLLVVIPELVSTKENVPIINHTLNMLLNGDKQLKYFIIELYLKTLKREPRCYRFVSAAIIQLMKNDYSWYSDATCARAMKYICENYPEHGENLVPLLSLPFTNGGLGKSTLFYLIKRFFINDFCIYSKYIRLCVRIHKGETVRYCVICTEGKRKLLKFLRIKSIKMGNVLAASVPPPPSPPPPTSGLLPNLEKPDSSETLNSSSRLSDGLKNPGTIEDLHKKCKDVFPANFEGAKLMFNKGLSNHFQISHTISMSSIAQSGYRFGATYVGTQQPVPSEAYPVLLGDIDPSGNLNANIIHQFGERLRGKLATQVQKSKFTAVQMTTDYRGDAYTVSLTLGNPDILNGSGVFVMHYLQSITPSVALGGELAYQRGPAVPGGQVAVLSAAGRYTNGDSTISGSLGLSGCHLCFHQKASQQLQVGVELEINCRIQESTGAIAYQIDLPKADLIFRGSVDTNWTVGAVLEKKLQPLPFTFALSGMINHSKPQFRLGCGLIIG